MNNKATKSNHRRIGAEDPLDVFVRDDDPMLVRGEIFSMSDDFFVCEKRRLADMMRRADGRSRRSSIRRVVIRWGSIAAAVCVLLVLTLVFPLNTTSQQVDQTVAEFEPATASTYITARSVQKNIAENTISQTTNTEWTQSDEAEEADVLMWLY